MLDRIAPSASLGAPRALVGGCAVDAAGYFFYGYWFSHSGV